MYGNLSKLYLLTNFDYYQRLQLLPDFIEQVASGLCALHSLGILHNDLKPDNILFRKAANGDLIFKIADLGLSGPKERILSQGHLGGTLWSRPPEVLSGRAFDGRNYFKIDTWALGTCCLYVLLRSYILTGENPQQLLNNIWLHSSSKDNFASLEEFILANRQGLITGTVDVKSILQSGYREQDLAIVNTVTRLLTLNPDQRPLVSQLVNCQQLETVIDYNLADITPASYQHNLDLWYLIRRCSDEVATVTVSYELCLRVLQNSKAAWLTGSKSYQHLVVVVVFLVKSYLHDIRRNLPFFKALSAGEANDDFISSTISVLTDCQGCLYNYHCTEAIDSINEELFFTTHYYQPSRREIEDWYSTTNDNEIRQKQRQYLDDHELAYWQDSHQTAGMKIVDYLPIFNTMISLSNTGYGTVNWSLLLAVDYFCQVVKVISKLPIAANDHKQLLLIAISCLELADNFDQAGRSGYLGIFNKTYAGPTGLEPFNLEDFNNCLNNDVLPNIDLSIINVSDYLWLSQWQVSGEHSNLMIYIMLATLTSEQAYLSGDLLPSTLWLASAKLADIVLGTQTYYHDVDHGSAVQNTLSLIMDALQFQQELNSSLYRLYVNKKSTVQQLYSYMEHEGTQ